MFIFIFQTIWLFIDDLAGKGLDIIIIGKFLFYLMPNLTEKVLPLTVLLSSILTFGTFAENYEFAAMKASGISLQRAMLSLIVFVLFLGGVTFYFANSVIPASEQKIYNMRRNIAKVKPAAAIEEGVFSDFEGMSIKVDEKFGEKDRFLRNVIIHQKTASNVNNTVIKAKTGELVSSERSDLIQLVLNDGHYYRDVQAKDNKKKRKYPFAKADFEVYRINIEIPEMDQDMEEERDISTDKMKNVGRLIKDIDSLKNDNLRIVGAFSKNIVNRMGGFVPLNTTDTIANRSPKIDQMPAQMSVVQQEQMKAMEEDEGDTPITAPIAEIAAKDSVLKQPKISKDSLAKITNVLDLFQDWQRVQVMNAARNGASSILSSVQGKKEEMQKRYKIYNMHILSLHKKYALALSCIVLFFVGAPLGAIIRKGGVGLPMVIAIILFLIYYFVGVFAGNYSKENNIHPILGAWLSTLIMLPLGIFLTKRATADKGMMNFSAVTNFFKKLFKRKTATT